MGVLQALVSDNGRLYAMWKGIPGDDRIFWSYWTGSGAWSAQLPMGGYTGVGPSMTVFNGLVYAAWKGEQADPRLFFSSLNGTTWAPQGIIPWAFSDQGPALGAIGNKMIAVWKNAWDQTLWYAEYDGHAWGAAALIAGVESSVGVSLALYNGKLYAALRGVSGNEHLFYISFDGSKWSGQGSLLGATSSVGPSLAGVGPYLYAVWRGADTDQALRWSFFNGTSWAPAGLISGGNSSEGAAISVFNGVLYAMWKGVTGDNTLWMSHLIGSAWAPVYQPGLGSTGQDPVGIVNPAPPPSVLGSYNNYFLSGSCSNLTNVQIFIGVTEDLVAAPPTPGNEIGFAFQFNCTSPIDYANPSNPNWIVWQQYIVGVHSSSMVCAINNWTAASLTGEQTINSPAPQVATLARASTIPAGSTISIELGFDGAGNVSSYTCNLTPGGTPVTLNLIGLPLTGGGKVTTANLAPIVAYELNLVGPGDGKHAHFTSGAGTIVYTGANAVTPVTSLYSVKAPGSQTACIANASTTGETSNSVYGLMPVGPSNTMSQAFAVNVKVQ